MARSLPSGLAIFLVSLFFSSSLTLAQKPSTNTPVPPLQWIELTSLTSGSAPPGLSYASMGYDQTSGTVIIFGGESNGFPVQTTYLLDASSLAWSKPAPPDGTQFSLQPPPRSAAIGGQDFAASNRHGHLVIGGKGLNGEPLSDAWEYDFNDQFWTEVNISPGGPSARWGASGGTDLLAPAVSDATVPGPNNTFYLAGGFDGTSAEPLSDVWQFDIAGVLTSNNVNKTLGSWSQLTGFSSKDLPSRVRQGGTVMPTALIVTAGGCNSTEANDIGDDCAQQDAHVLTVASRTDISPSGGCPAPRVGPVVVPNYNAFSTSFNTQAFVLLGMFNNSFWDDGNGLQNGEVDVFETNSGSWARILPAGDPGSSDDGTVKFPSPREGAAAITSPIQAIVGSDHAVGWDVLVYGGRDADGNYLNDLWLLRGYMGSITSTNASWSGFGDGVLTSGADATGAGVKIQYMTTCATALSPPTGSGSNAKPTGTSTGSAPAQTGSSGQGAVAIVFPYDTNVLHKLFSPLSVGLLLAAFLFYRLSLPSLSSGASERRGGFVLLAAILLSAAYGLGIAGIAVSFSSISSSSSPNPFTKRSASSSLILKTAHGKAGIAFFVALYGLIPVQLAYHFMSAKSSKKGAASLEAEQPDDAGRKNSNETGFTALTNTLGRSEKVRFPSNSTNRPGSPLLNRVDNEAPVTPDTATPLAGEERQRSRSWAGGKLWPGYFSKDKLVRRSSDSGVPSTTSASTPAPTSSFEVLNRGNRARRLSANNAGHHGMPRSLSDFSWLDRRRNMNAVGELDYALTQFHNHQAGLAVPGTATPSTAPLMVTQQDDPRPFLPSKLHSFAHITLQSLLLSICVVALVALWQRAPKVTFVVFLIWTLAFYAGLFILAWRGRPRQSILTVLLVSLKDHSHPHVQHHTPIPVVPPSPTSSHPLSTVGQEGYPFPSDTRSPYTFHQPSFRRALSPSQEDDYLSSNGHRPSPEAEEDEEDEETQQRRIEQEMNRRDVSIVTVPKRKLWVVNPS